MAGAVERIEQDIAALDEKVKAIAQEFHDTYHQYLTNLGQSVRQQLILASYHICTKGYPERFLKLSFSQRQNLQQALQKLVQQAQVQLIELIEVAYLDVASADDLDEEDIESDAAESDAVESDKTEATDIGDSAQASVLEFQTLEFQTLEFQTSESQPLEFQSSGVESPEPPLDQASLEQSEFQTYAPPDSSPVSEEESPIAEEEKLTATIEVLDSPEAVAYWEERIEEGIVEMLQTVSHAANRLLQKAAILPDKLPEPALEVAAKSGLATEVVSGPPNLLNLLVETEDDEEESAVTHIIAIQLRLSEIEFSDATLSTWRSKIRSLLARLVQLGRQYQKKQRERAIAEAEDAWRSSWFEE